MEKQIYGSKKMSENDFNFERSFLRLETILEKMNSGNVSLDDSLKLYEEADGLIASCAQKLNSVEEKIEMLIKKRDGSLETNMKGDPQTEPFQVQEAGT